MIPKIIHYCWFGRGKLPELAQKCIASWHKHCHDYEIIEWNEDNFDIQSNMYVRQAYESKKYAFVSDYVRLYALCAMGGVYMDTDVELIRPIDEFLTHNAFSGFEKPDAVPTGIMGCERNFELFKELMQYYDNRSFIRDDGEMDTTTNTKIITDTLKKHGLKLKGEFQIISGFALYPRDYFCPYDNNTGKLMKTINTAAIHWFSKSWLPLSIRARLVVTRIFHRIFGDDCFRWLKRK